MEDRMILITGATGKQGGATLRHLAKAKGFKLRALTRKPNDKAAAVVAGLGAQVVGGDLDDAASLERALQGVWGVFAVQNTWEAGVEKEEEQGKRLATLARAAGVQRFVYSSVGSAHKKTGIPHFENKFRVEGKVKSLGFPSYAIVRPVFFMENLLMPWSLQGDKLTAALKPDSGVQMIAVDDIGKFVAKTFVDAEALRNVDFDIAGDTVSMAQAAKALSEVLGTPIKYEQIPMEVLRGISVDQALMIEWFESTGYSADIATLETRFGIRPQTFAEWVRAQHR